MRINSNLGTQQASVIDNDAGEGLAVFFSQNGESTARYRFLVKAKIDQGIYDVGEFFSSPPLATSGRPGRPSRMISGVVCPGAIGWSVDVSCVATVETVGEPPVLPQDDTADIILASSRCCTTLGVSRVGERYDYQTDAAIGVTQYFIVKAGMKVTGIAVIGLTGGGTVEIDGGATITVADGVGLNLAPEVSIPPNALIAMGNVNWVVEYLESA